MNYIALMLVLGSGLISCRMELIHEEELEQNRIPVVDPSYRLRHSTPEFRP